MPGIGDNTPSARLGRRSSSRMALGLAILLLAATALFAETVGLNTSDGLLCSWDAERGTLRELAIDNRPVTVPERAARFRLIDAVSEEAAVVTTTASSADEGIVLSGEAAALGLSLSVRAASRGECLWFDGSVQDLTGRERAVIVAFELPIFALGGRWWDNIEHAREVSDAVKYESLLSDRRWAVAEGEVSNYPFAALDLDGAAGLTLAVPPTEPRVFRIGYNHQRETSSWLELKFYFGLTPQTRNFPGSASFSFLLYRHDPEWGLRSSAQRYYGLFPGCYELRLKEPIYLGYATDKSRYFNRYEFAKTPLEQPEDFGKIFPGYVGHSHLCYTGAFSYEDPAEEPPTPGEALEIVKALAEALKDRPEPEERLYFRASVQLDGQPRDLYVENPQFVYDAAVFEEDGQPLVRIGPSRWVKGWNLNFDLYPNPALNPTRLDFFRKGIEDALQELPAGTATLMTSDGLDNHGGGPMRADFRAEHFPFAIVPLTYGKASKKPCLAFLGHAFLRELDKLRREHGLYYEANAQHAFARSAIYADVQFCDVFMIEWGGSASEEVTHDVSRYMRTICYQKMVRYWPAFATLAPFVNKDPDGQRQAIDQHFQRGLFWGIFPGFGSVPEVEKYRDLYKRYIPVLEELFQARWQPVTLAHVNRPEVGIERFGDPAQGPVYLSLRNLSEVDARVRVSLDRELVPTPRPEGERAVYDMLTDTRFPVDIDGEGVVNATLPLAAFQTCVLRIEA